MIHVTMGETKVEGTFIELEMEFTCLVKTLFKNKIFSKEDLEKCIKLGTMNKEDLINELFASLDKFSESLK